MDEENEVIESAGEVAGESVEQVTHVEKTEAAPKAEEKTDSGPKTMLEAIEKDYDAKRKAEEKVEKVAEKPAEKKDADKPKPKPEELLKMPEGLKEDGQRRFQRLIDTNKQITSEVQTLQSALKENEQTLEGFRKTLSETGTTADDLGQFFGYKEKLTRGDLNGAMQVLQAQMKSLALAMGKPIDMSGANPLSDFKDLSDSVANFELPEDRALEIARARKMEADSRARNEAQRRSQQSSIDAEAHREAAIGQVEAWASGMAKQDIDYASKEATIVSKLKDISAKYPPNLWLTRIQEEYSAIVKPAPVERDTSPLRRGGSGNPGAPAPKTMAEAIGAQLGWN